MSMRWRQVFVEFESVVALVVTFAGGFIPPLLFGLCGLIEAVTRRSAPEFIVMLILFVVTAANAIWVAGMARAALAESCPRVARLLECARRRRRGKHNEYQPASGEPLAVVMARRLPRLPWPLRWLVGLWWGAQFAGVAALGIFIYGVLDMVLKNAPLHHRLLIPLSYHMALLFAANLYLLLAVAAFFRNPIVHAKLWSWRFIVDLTLSLAAWWLATHG
jgi:hypothetical protein